jgi:hypothetical protein
MVALPVEGAPLSAERRQSNERPVADGRSDPMGRDRFMACGMVRSSGLSAKTSAKAPAQEPCPRGKTHQKLAGESLLAGASSGGRDWELRVQAARYPAGWKIIDCDRPHTGDQCGTPKTKVSRHCPGDRRTWAERPIPKACNKRVVRIVTAL